MQFENNTMYLSQANIDMAHGQALRNFLVETRDLTHRRLYRIIIDECNMTDEVFSMILDGAYQ